MAQTTHILRRGPRPMAPPAEHTTTELYDRARAELEQLAPSRRKEPDTTDERWIRHMEELAEAALDKMRLMKGYSDRNRWKFQSVLWEQIKDALFEAVVDADEAFRHGLGHHPRFKLDRTKLGEPPHETS